MTPSQIADLCQKQDALQQNYLKGYYSMDTKNPKIYSLLKPATESQIKAGENYWGLPYPPSYRMFLKRHNGWLQFATRWSLKNH